MALEISLLDNRGGEMDEVGMPRSFIIGSGENVKMTHVFVVVFLFLNPDALSSPIKAK